MSHEAPTCYCLPNGWTNGLIIKWTRDFSCKWKTQEKLSLPYQLPVSVSDFPAWVTWLPALPLYFLWPSPHICGPSSGCLMWSVTVKVCHYSIKLHNGNGLTCEVNLYSTYLYVVLGDYMRCVPPSCQVECHCSHINGHFKDINIQMGLWEDI